MNKVLFVGFSALFSMTMGCTARSEASDEPRDEQSPLVGAPASCTPLPATPATMGVLNPASVYCEALGYTTSGADCAFPDGTSCEQWAFYRGECGQAHSFCNLHGGSVSNVTENMGSWTASYALCTLPTGQQCKDDDFAHSCSCL